MSLSLWLTLEIVTKLATAMVYFENSNKYLFKKRKEKIFYFFQAEKKVTKKPLGHLRLCPRPRNALKVENEREVD